MGAEWDEWNHVLAPSTEVVDGHLIATVTRVE